MMNYALGKLQSGKVKVVVFFLLLVWCSALSAQQKIPSNLVRDTIFHKSGLTYFGKITAHKKTGNTRLRKLDGWSMNFDAETIDRIGWSERSRLKFIKEIVNLDSFPTIDVLYLTDGSILRGQILEYEQGAFLRFKIKSGEIRLVETDIEKIAQEPKDPLVMVALQRQKKPKVYAFREKGLYSAVGFALMQGGGAHRSEVGNSLQASLGYQFRRQLGVGLGVSLDGYANMEGGDTFLPVFAEARGYLWEKHNTPYWVIAGGYGFPLRMEVDNQEFRRFEGGYLFHPAIGYRFGAGKALNLTVDVGYKFQKAITEREFFFSGEIVTRDIIYRRLSLRMSVLF